MNYIRTIFLLLSLSSCYIGEELPPDQEIWEYSLPWLQGMNNQGLLDIDGVVEDGNFGQIHSIIIIKNDKLIFENYYGNGTRQETLNTGRISFSILALAIDLFVEDGLINSLDDPIYPYLPEYDFLFEDDTTKKLITFQHILRHQSGLSSDQELLIRMRRSDDWAGYILSREMESALPGQRVALNPGTGIILSKIMQNLLGSQELEAYFNERLFHKIGITNYFWERDPSGTLNGANGIDLSTIDQAKFGYLMLQEGRWLEKRRIIQRDWVLEVSKEQKAIDNNFSYGLGWKVFTEDLKARFRLLGTKTYFSDGGSGQGIYIIPEYNLVVSISSENVFNGDAASVNLFLYILESLESADVNE